MRALRFEELADALGELQPLNNNDNAQYAAMVQAHGLDLTVPLDEADALVRGWLSSAAWPWPEDVLGGWYDEPPEFLRLDPAALAATVVDLKEFAKSGLLMLDEDDEEVVDPARIDGLVDGLVGAFRDRVGEPILAYSHGLPLQECVDGLRLWGDLVLVGPERAGVLHANYSC